MKIALAACFFALGLVATCHLRVHAADNEPAALDSAKIEFFEKHIRPVLVEHCYSCHSAGADNVEGELLLDTRAAVLTGGASGKALVPGDPANSLIVKALQYDSLEMPPDRRLPPEVVRNFEKWIADGAVDPRVSESAPPPRPSSVDWDAARKFWSFQPPRPQPLPEVQGRQWPLGRLDSFVLAAMEARDLMPAQPVERRALARRATLDLCELPGDFEAIEAFASDTRADAWTRFVDRLLASPAFGERFARLWLDIARYAEDQAHIVGNDRSLCYPNAYHYRDWVIEAFNGDLPYDSFIRQQLAADLFEAAEPRDLRPLGFLGLGPKYYNRGSPEVMADEWEDRVDVVTRGVLGLTVACARCHDHKYDPIPTEDYYALAGVFASTAMFNRPLEDSVEKKDSGDAKKPEESLHIVRDGKPTDLQVMIRGDAKRKGPLAPRGFLKVLCDDQAPAWQLADSSGRRELAEALVEPKNPLVARVIVNRIWAALIGRPLVTTPSNFGRLGAEPSHPELLDDLAVGFIEAGWSIKWLVREIVLSNTYQQSTLATEGSDAKDPDNVWLARMNRKRLSVEAWRDSILAGAGRLDRRIGGPSINPQDPQVGRRTLYSEVSRLELNKLLSLFDFPDPNAHAERRAKTTTALQKLFVLNSDFMLAQAQWAAEAAPQAQLDDRIGALFQHVLARQPSADELSAFRDYLQARTGDTSDDEQARSVWTELAHVLLASNELMFVD